MGKRAKVSTGWQLKEVFVHAKSTEFFSHVLSQLSLFPSRLERLELTNYSPELYWMTPSKKNREKIKGAKCNLKLLKVIELRGYCGRTSDVELLMYFVENAAALEKIVIDPRSQLPAHLKYKLHSHVRKAAITSALEEAKQLVPKHVELVIL